MGAGDTHRTENRLTASPVASARAEALMREHANIGVSYGALFGLDDAIATGNGVAP